jgi:hypothetical protein
LLVSKKADHYHLCLIKKSLQLIVLLVISHGI